MPKEEIYGVTEKVVRTIQVVGTVKFGHTSRKIRGRISITHKGSYKEKNKNSHIVKCGSIFNFQSP